MRTPILTVMIKQVYGKDTIYPVCEQAQLFAKLLGRKTLTLLDLSNIRALGYQFQVTTTQLSA